MRREVWECEVQFRFVYYEEIKRQAKRIQIIVYECRCNESRRLKAKSEVGIYTPRIHWLGISWGESTYWRVAVCQSKIDFVELGLVSMVQNDNGCIRERKSPRIVISTHHTNITKLVHWSMTSAWPKSRVHTTMKYVSSSDFYQLILTYPGGLELINLFWLISTVGNKQRKRQLATRLVRKRQLAVS